MTVEAHSLLLAPITIVYTYNYVIAGRSVEKIYWLTDSVQIHTSEISSCCYYKVIETVLKLYVIVNNNA